ncbi:hypothetical protein QTP88_004549 [Uroleucon formosanum]
MPPNPKTLSDLGTLPDQYQKTLTGETFLIYDLLVDNSVNEVRDGLKTIENEKGQILYEKFKSVFDKNPGYNILKLYNNSINGNYVDLKEDPAIISCYKQCPITSVDVEHDVCIKNQIMCIISGQYWRSTYVFNINELPERCDVFIVGEYVFDRKVGADSLVMESDKDIFRAFVNACIPVYTIVGFEIAANWNEIFDYSDKNVYQTEVFDPLVTFLNEFNINGILLFFGDLYTGIFDFSITNKVLDIYIIDYSLLNDCNNNTFKTGTSPITSTGNTIVTIEQVTCSVTNSYMDKSKIYAAIELAPRIPFPLLPDYAMISLTSYSIYCSSADKSNSSQWCTSPSQLIYDQLVIPKNPASHKFLEENSSKIFIAVSNRTKHWSLRSIQILYTGIYLNLDCIPLSV